MKTFIKSGNAKLWIYIGALVFMAFLWKAGEAISGKLASLPIKTAPKSTVRTASIDQKSFYAVWVKRLAASSPEIIENDQAVENLFKQKEEKPEILSPEIPVGPDYVQIFKDRVQITGISNDGVFLNNQFYRAGQKIYPLSMPRESGKPVVPVLQSIQDGRIVFSIEKKTAVFLTGEK